MSTITAILAGLVLTAAQFPFDDQAPVVPAIAHPQWASLARQQAQDQTTIDDCLAQARQCPAHLHGYRALVLSATTLSPTAQVQAVNQFIDAHWLAGVVPGSDPDQSAWRTLSHFLRAGGGRDDAAIAKYFALRQLGFDTSVLRIVVPYALTTAQPRPALLAIALDGGTWLLGVGDEHTAEHVAADTYAINENFWWDRALFGSGGRRAISL